ncbi:uncharacterized protein LOC114866567 [Betta splendens]|uniref:Uncharacterized protein LOC114866567 n=1 Tax=Betta splendens TaxID=158456 RepID=A0A6P7NWI8_BETSP|nr:uncharacterized protein LOC114866567 [Betta splendens]XP_029024287.1 uncharacterized protein LOC114866567 [Betta splendens]
MQVGHEVTSNGLFQTHSQQRRPIPLDTIQPIYVRAIINPKRGMEEALQPQAPQQPNTCGSSGAEKSCLDIRVAVFLVTLAGAVILLLLYKLLQARHRLSVARAMHAVEYYSFYHTATYTLKHPGPCQDPPPKNGTVGDAPPVLAVATVKPVDITPLPLAPTPSPAAPALPPPPPPPVRAPSSCPPAPPVLAVPLPVVYTTPPSPHPSLGACSDTDVYSRIGAFRPSRLSSLSTHSTVILFEHSSL